MKIFKMSRILAASMVALIVFQPATLLFSVNLPVGEPRIGFPPFGITSYDPTFTQSRMAFDIKNSTIDTTVAQWAFLKTMYDRVYRLNDHTTDFLYLSSNMEIRLGPPGYIYRNLYWCSDACKLVGGFNDGYYGNIPFSIGSMGQPFLGRYSYKVGGYKYEASFQLNFWCQSTPPIGMDSMKYRFHWRILKMTPDPTEKMPPEETVCEVVTTQTFDRYSLNVVVLPTDEQIGSKHWKIAGVWVGNETLRGTSIPSWGNIYMDPSINP